MAWLLGDMLKSRLKLPISNLLFGDILIVIQKNGKANRLIFIAVFTPVLPRWSRPRSSVTNGLFLGDQGLLHRWPRIASSVTSKASFKSVIYSQFRVIGAYGWLSINFFLFINFWHAKYRMWRNVFNLEYTRNDRKRYHGFFAVFVSCYYAISTLPAVFLIPL